LVLENKRGDGQGAISPEMRCSYLLHSICKTCLSPAQLGKDREKELPHQPHYVTTAGFCRSRPSPPSCKRSFIASIFHPLFKRQSMRRIAILRSHLSTMASSTNYSLTSTIKLNNGDQMPRIHLGVYITSNRETSTAVTHALEAGYRGFDSAEWYANEREVGSAISKYLKENKDSGIKREDIWFTTKLKTNSGYEATRGAIMDSVWKSGLRYLDLYLLHSPYGGKERRLACWRAVEDAIEEGVVRAGGMSNFGVKHVSILFSPFPRICVC
jgi:Aldo/keto reductase family